MLQAFLLHIFSCTASLGLKKAYTSESTAVLVILIGWLMKVINTKKEMEREREREIVRWNLEGDRERRKYIERLR